MTIDDPFQEQTAFEEINVDLAYPGLAGRQHLCLLADPNVHHPGTLRRKDKRRTVLAGAGFPHRRVFIPHPTKPGERIPLPSWEYLMRNEKHTIREMPTTPAYINNHRVGILLKVPGLYTAANSIVRAMIEDREYDYDLQLLRMAENVTHLLYPVLRRAILHVRERPALIGHALALAELARDEIAISPEFGRKILERYIQPALPDRFPSVAALNGFPMWGTRFPLANSHGIMPMRLRIVGGQGRFLGFNPWTLKHLFLGDEDGDTAQALFRLDEVVQGKLELQPTTTLHVDHTLSEFYSELTLQSVFEPYRVHSIREGMRCVRLNHGTLQPVRNKMQLERFRMLSALERIEQIHKASAKSDVGIYTMYLGWLPARALALSGLYPNVEAAYKAAYDMLEPFIEGPMDARKSEGGRGITDRAFATRLKTRLRKGWELPFVELEERLGADGMPEEQRQAVVGLLRTIMKIAQNDLRTHCDRSVIYKAVGHLTRNSDPHTNLVMMLRDVRRLGVAPEALYQTMIDDLQCLQTLEVQGPRAIPETVDLKQYLGEDGC